MAIEENSSLRSRLSDANEQVQERAREIEVHRRLASEQESAIGALISEIMEEFHVLKVVGLPARHRSRGVDSIAQPLVHDGLRLEITWR